MSETALTTGQHALILDSEGNPVPERQPERATDLDQFIMQAAGRQDVSIDKLERLLAMKQDIEAARRKEAFYDALASVQAILPQVEQNGLIDYGQGKGKIAFAKMEDIDAAIRPLYVQKGFSVSWDSELVFDGKMIRVTGSFASHGHIETRQMTAPIDNSGGKNPVQGHASTIAYLKRQISKMFWNLVEKGLDKDGANLESMKTITQEQADDIRSVLTETKSNVAAFLKLLRVNSVEEIRAGQLKEVWTALDKKRGVTK